MPHQYTTAKNWIYSLSTGSLQLLFAKGAQWVYGGAKEIGVRCCYLRLGIAPRAQLLKKGDCLLHPIGDKAPPAARDNSEVASTLNRRCYSETSVWAVNGILYPGRSHACYLVRVTGGSLTCGRYLLVVLIALWYSESSIHQLGSRKTVFIPRWITHPCILPQVRATRGAITVVF